VSQCEGQNDTDAIRRLFLQGTRYVLWLIVPVQLGMWTLGKPFLSLWLGAGYAERCYPTLVILSAPLALTLSQSISGRILYGIGKLRSFSRMLLIEAMCNLGLSLLLVGDYGIEGVAIGTAIPNLILNAALAVYTCSTLQVGLGAYVKRGILAPCALGAIPVMVWMGWDRLFAIHSWPAFIGAGAAGTLCYAVVALLVEPGAWRLREFAVRKLANVGHTPLWRQPVDSY
jgi:O-antigen/teichoic acid export membrane protein